MEKNVNICIAEPLCCTSEIKSTILQQKKNKSLRIKLAKLYYNLMTEKPKPG